MAVITNVYVFVLYQTLYTLFLVIKTTLEAIYRLLIPYRYRSKSVRGQNVLITGAGSGIGRLMAKRFAKLGARIIIVDVNSSGNQTTANEVIMAGGSAVAFTCDLSNKDNIKKLAEQVKSSIGDVHVLVNNAGIVTGKEFLEADDASIEKTMAVNTMSHFWMIREFLPSMLKNNHGHIVTVSSLTGVFGSAGLCDYSASKAAVIGLDSSLRFELLRLKRTGVKTTCVCPYLIDTGMFHGASSPLVPYLKPEYVADKIVEAVLTDQKLLILPRIFYFAVLFKGIISEDVEHHLSMNFLQTCHMMDSFIGRK